MKRLAISLLLILIAVPLFAEGTKTWRLPLLDGEALTDAVLDDDLVSTIALADYDRVRSRIVRVGADGKVLATSVFEGATINRLQPLTGKGRFYVGMGLGGGAHDYAWKVIELDGNAARTIWSSTSLPADILKHDPRLDVSADGSWWAAVYRGKPETRLEVRAGRTSDSKVVFRTHMSLDLKASRAPGFDFQSLGVELLEVGADGPLLAILNQGLTFVMSPAPGADPVRAVLNSPRGGYRLKWQPSSRTVWVDTSTDAWYGFRLPEKVAGGKRVSPDVEVSKESRAGRGPKDVFPLTNGKLHVVFHDEVAAEQSTMRINPAGTAALVLPRGGEAGIAHVKVF